MRITSAVLFAATGACALAACQQPKALPTPVETVRLVKAPADLADLGVAGYRVHQPVTADAPGVIEFLDANRATVGKLTSSTVRSETSVSTTMTIDGLGNAAPLAITDEAVGDGTLTRVTIQRGAETTRYEQDAAGAFLVAADGRIPIDDEHQAALSAALSAAAAPISADPRFQVLAALSRDPKLTQAPELKGMLFNHKSPLCSYLLGGLVTACITTCMASGTPLFPAALPACLIACSVTADDLLYCQLQASSAVNDAQCNARAPAGYTGHADATEHQCINQCDATLCNSNCITQPKITSGTCQANTCVCWQKLGEDDDGTGGGDGTDGFDGTGDSTGDGTSGSGGSCTWCDCTSESDEFHGMVCGDTPTEIIDACWGSC